MDSFEIQLEQVTFTYEDGVNALSELNLVACAGEFVVVLGANGAGKSTLCFLLSGIVPHIYGGRRAGKVSIAGNDPWDEPLYKTAKYSGVLLQDPEVQLFNPSVFTEMAFGPANLKIDRAEIIQRIEAAMTLLHLDGLEKRNPRDLSGGQKQRVALGAALTMRPRVLVLDEPTSQLDPIGRAEVVEAIHRLKSTGEMTIVMTTHETGDILDLADRVVVLDQGRIILSGTPAEVFSQPETLEAAGVKIPDSLGILLNLDQRAGVVTHLSDEQVKNLDSNAVSRHARELVGQERLEVIGPQEEPLVKINTASQPALEAVNLTFQYPGYPPVKALENINLAVPKGEIVGIIGQNGSGKSTLVKSFVGLLRPTRGEVRVNGQNIASIPVGQMARQVGLVLQNPDYQLFTSSCREEILFGLKNLGVEGDEAEEKVRTALTLVGLENEWETFPFRMSFGDRRKLAVAATIALDPQVLILDEPTTAQDHLGRYQLADISRRIRDESGRTILMITHDMDLIAHYAERLVVMWNGSILLDAPSGEAFAQKDLLARTFLRPPVTAEIAANLQDLGVSASVITPDAFLNHFRRAS
ncbi:MAG: ATP-binding cassette domain-containing protein [Anaerolineales bacterium]|nr:ATP-binding cassette domain-containing protein [Anaerolineales bacterium]